MNSSEKLCKRYFEIYKCSDINILFFNVIFLFFSVRLLKGNDYTSWSFRLLPLTFQNVN